MKKQLSLLISSCVIFSLISCNKQQEQENSNKSSLPILITSPLDSSENDSSSGEIISSTSSVVDTYYHVTFVNYDARVLYEGDVLKGSAATYSGEDHTKEDDDEFTYEFDGWDKELTNIQSDTTFVAQYKAVAKEGWGPIIWF